MAESPPSEPPWIATKGPYRAELIAVAWEIFSAILFASSVLTAALDSPLPAIAFGGSLVVSAVALPFLVSKGKRGLAVAGVIRVLAWPIAASTIAIDLRIIVASAAFGAMAWALRRAVYRRELIAFSPAVSTSPDFVKSRLAESAMVTGIIGGHVLLLFSVAFLHVQSKVVFRGWWQLVPVMGAVATLAFTGAMRWLSRPVTDALSSGAAGSASQMRQAIQRARRLPLMLSYLNFAIWVGCTTGGVFYFRTSRDSFTATDAVMQVAYAAIFSWGVSFAQRGWDHETLAPLERTLSAWLRLAEDGATGPVDPPSSSRLPGKSEAKRTLRQRMLRDFGGPLLFIAGLSLLSSLGLYRTIGRQVSLREDLNAILALFASFFMLVLAVGTVVARVARNLSQPLTIVAEAAESVAQGELETRIGDVRGPEEVMRMARSVESMRMTLARTIGELEHERRTLEANVEARTAELSRALEELREAEAALVQGERLASIGELVAGVAHEIMNPINAVAGSAEPLERVTADVRRMLDAYRAAESSLPPEQRNQLEKLRAELDLDAELDDLVGISSLVKRATNRTVRIVQNLKNFSRRSVEALPADLHAGIEETLMLLGARLRHSCITVTKDFGALPEVVCRSAEINQVFMNLMMNAVQSLEGPRGPSGGPPGADAGILELRIVTRKDRGFALVSIEDNGPGVLPGDEAKIFAPFFTTKPTGQGTGLGLSISTDIVRKHGGSLTLEHPDQGGARFVMKIPLQPAIADRRSSRTSDPMKAQEKS